MPATGGVRPRPSFLQLNPATTYHPGTLTDVHKRAVPDATILHFVAPSETDIIPRSHPPVTIIASSNSRSENSATAVNASAAP